jgi:glucokinase
VVAALVGVDLGGTTIKAALVSPQLEVLRHERAETPLESMRELIEALEALVRRTGEGADVRAVGFGLPSQIDQRSGRIADSVNVPLADLPFVEEMRGRLALPVRVDNDANVACLAEARMGAARGTRYAIMVTLGTGVGGGVLVDGEIYRGAKGAGGELGHVVVDEDGPRCQGHCPNRGCLEILASATGLIAAYRTLLERSNLHEQVELHRGVTEMQARDVLEAAERGDDAARQALAIVGRHLGVGLSSFVNIFDPEVIVIGGGLSVAGERIIGPARAEMQKRSLPFSREGVRVVPAVLGNDAGVLGAAALVAAEAGRPA